MNSFWLVLFLETEGTTPMKCIELANHMNCILPQPMHQAEGTNAICRRLLSLMQMHGLGLDCVQRCAYVLYPFFLVEFAKQKELWLTKLHCLWGRVVEPLAILP